MDEALPMSDLELKELMASLVLSQKETVQSQKETARQMKETDLKIEALTLWTDKINGSVGREWGLLVESLVEASCLKQMQQAGMKVTQTAERTLSTREGFAQEWDTLLVNGGELVAIEVKTRFGPTDLRKVEEKLAVFRKAFPPYESYKVYGGIAALRFDAGAERLAEKHGLFVFKPSGEIMSLINREGFKPRAF